MMIASIRSGADNRAFVLLYLMWVILSLVPSVVGPSERNFKEGQPELQQAMDNMIVRDGLVKRSSSEDKNNRALLNEAENMLASAKDMREKEWLEQFIHKLKILASVLEQNNANRTLENETAQSLSNLTDDHLQQQNSSDFKSKTVPETKPGQLKLNQLTSKFPSTLSETAQVKSETIDHVTKPGMTATEKDELVEELESLHKLSSFEIEFDRSVGAPETSSTPVEVVTQPSLLPESNEEKEHEKEKLKERIANEVAALKKLGETEENILSAMHIEGPTDSKVLKDEAKESEHAPVKRVLDENNPHYWTHPENHIPEPPRQIYMNNTFLGMHINLPPVNPRVLRRQFHYGLHRNAAVNNFPLYHNGLKGTIQKLQNNQNFLQKNHMHGVPNFLPQGRAIQQQRHGGINPYRIPSQSETRYSKDNPALNQYVHPNFRPLYMPYPLNQNVEQRSNADTNSTTYSLSKLPTEFSEEIKRQLRDGKVILLSDNVVGSNFTSDEDKGGVYKPKK